MVDKKCEVCGCTSFRVEDGVFVCNDCNYVNEEIQEYFEEAFEIKDNKIGVEDKYVEKDIYNIIQKLYKDKDLIINITKYILKENDDFFINFQKILFEICQILISNYNFPIVLYKEVKKIWFYLLEDCIKKYNIYRPPNDNKHSLRCIYEVMKSKTITNIFKSVINDININEEIRNTIKKIGYSKTNYYFNIQKEYINQIKQMAEFFPKKSEMNRKFNIRFLKLYKKTSLLDSENQNKNSFKKLAELISSLKSNKTKNDTDLLKENETNKNGLIESYKDNEYGYQNDYTFDNSENILNQFVDKNDFLYNSDELLNQESLNLFQNFTDQMKEEEEEEDNKKYTKENISQFENKKNNNLDESYPILDSERMYHFCSSNFINKLLQNKNLLKPHGKKDTIRYMNRSTNYNKPIGIIYQHDFLYYFIEELKKKADIEHLSYYDILQTFKGNYDQIISNFLKEESEKNEMQNLSPTEENNMKRHATEEELNELFPLATDKKGFENEQGLKTKENYEQFASFGESKIDDNLEGIEIKSEFKFSDDFGELANVSSDQNKFDLLDVNKEIDVISNWDSSEKTESFSKWNNISYKAERAKINELEKHKNKINEKIKIENIFEKYKNYITLKKDIPKNNMETKVEMLENIFSDQDNQSYISNKEINLISDEYNQKQNVLSNQFENLDSYSLEGSSILRLANDEGPKGDGSVDFEKIEVYMEENEEGEKIEEETTPFSKIEEAKKNNEYVSELQSMEKKQNSNEIDNDLKENRMENMNIYDKLECVNNLKKEKLKNLSNQNMEITNDSYYNGVIKKIDTSIKKVRTFIEENINTQKFDNNKIYVNENLLLDTYIFDGIYKKNLYISSIKKFRNITIRYIYNEYINYFLNEYKEYMDDNEEYKYCYNFTFELILYILYYSFKRLNIYCLPHNMKYFVNSDNFDLYHIFNNTSENFYKLFKELDTVNFPLKNSYLSEIKKCFFTRTLNCEIPFLCIHADEQLYSLDYDDDVVEDEETIFGDTSVYNKIEGTILNGSSCINHNYSITNLQICESIGLNKMFRKYRTYTINSNVKKKWRKMLSKFNGYFLTKLYSLINDLLFVFNLPNRVQIYSIKILNIIIFRYRFFKFLYNIYCSKYDDMHTQLNNSYSYKNIYNDCLKYYPKNMGTNCSTSPIHKYIKYLKKKELYIKKIYIETKKYINPEDGTINYQVYNKINYFYRQKFYYTFCNVNYHIDFKKSELYKVAAGCVIVACKLYYPFFIDDFYDYQNLYIPDKFEAFHMVNHHNCHRQENVNLHNNKIYPTKKGGEKGDERGAQFYTPKIERLLKRHDREGKSSRNKTNENEDEDENKLSADACRSKNAFEKKRKSYRGGKNCKEEKIRKLSSHTYKEKAVPDNLETSQDNQKEKCYSSNTLDCGFQIGDIHNVEPNELNECQSVSLPLLSDDGGNDENGEHESFYIDLLSEKENSHFLPYLNKETKKNEINMLDDFFDDNYTDDCIYDLVSYGNKKDTSSSLLDRKKNGKIEEDKKMKKKLNRSKIRGIYFKSTKENTISYYVSVPKIINLYFNYKKCLTVDTYKNFINKEMSLSDCDDNLSDEIYHNEDEYFEKNIYKKLFIKEIPNENIQKRKSAYPQRIINQMVNDELYQNYIIKHKSFTNLDQTNNKKDKRKYVFPRFCVMQNNQNLEEIYHTHSKDLERVEQIKTKILPFFLASYYAHPFNYFSINMQTICFCNLIKQLENENLFSLSREGSQKWEVLCDLFKNKNSYSHSLQQINESMQNVDRDSHDDAISKNSGSEIIEVVSTSMLSDNDVIAGRDDSSQPLDISLPNAQSNNTILLKKLISIKKKEIKKKKRKTIARQKEDKKTVKKRKRKRNVNNHFNVISYNEATNFIKENKFSKKKLKNIYNLISNMNKVDIGMEKKNDGKICYTYLINKQNYEKAYLIYVIFEHNLLGLYSFQIENILNLFQFLIERIDNIYQLYLLYYQINNVVYVYSNCASYIINMYKYFLFIIHQKKSITKNNFNSFYRNKYIKKKKHLIYNIKMVSTILKVFINLHGSYKDVYKLYLEMYGKKHFRNEKHNLIKLNPVIYFDDSQFLTLDRSRYLEDSTLYSYSAIKYGTYHLSYLFDNLKGIKFIKHEINTKNKYVLNKLNKKMKQKYKQVGNVHAYIFPPFYGIVNNIVILNKNFFFINFKRTIELMQNNYDNYLSNYYKKYNFMNKDSFEKTQILIIATKQVEKKNNDHMATTICLKKKVMKYFPTYISQLHMLNSTGKEMSYLFKYRTKSTNLNKYYFLHNGTLNIIKKLIKNMNNKHSKILYYNKLKELTNCKEYKIKTLKNKYLQNGNDNFHILNDFEDVVNYDVINYFPLNFFKFYKKMKNKIKNTHYIFLLYYWKFCFNLKKGNQINSKNVFINEKVATLIYDILFFYSMKRGTTIEETKINKLLKKYNVLDYVKLFRHILNVEFKLVNQKKVANKKNVKNKMQRPTCSMYFPANHTKKCRKQNSFKKANHKLVDTSNDISNRKKISQPLNLETNRTNCIYNGIRVKPMSILKYQKNFVNFTKCLYNPKMEWSENYFNKVFIFNITNEGFLNYRPRGEQRKGTLIKNAKFRKKKKKYLLELERFFQSIMIYDFLNNNKKIFLIKNIDNLYEQLKKENTNLDKDNLRNPNKNYVIPEMSKKKRKKNREKYNNDLKQKFFKYFSYIQAIRKNPNEEISNIRERYNINKLPPNFLWDQNIVKSLFINNSNNYMINNIASHSINDNNQIDDGTSFYNNQDSLKTEKNKENTNNKARYTFYDFKCIPFYHSKLYRRLQYLLSNVPLNYKLCKLIKERCRGDTDIPPRNTREYTKIIDNFMYGSRNDKENKNLHETDEYMYMSTDVDSYKSDTVYNIKLYKTDSYNNFKKYIKKNLIKLKLFTKGQPNCYINKCADKINQTEINDSLFHDMCKIYLNFFHKINEYFYFKNNKKENSHYYTNYDNIIDSNNFNMIKHKYGHHNHLGRIFEWHNNLEIYDPLLVLNNKTYRSDSKKKKKKTWLCIYNDRSYLNFNNASISAEVRKKDQDESTLLNYNLNKNVHFEFNSNLNCFLLRFKNDYIKNKNKNLYITIKENRLYKVKYAQNIIQTNKYTYFLFSCLVFSVHQAIKVMYIFSLQYFPSLFFKTLNYLNYLKMDDKFLQFLQCNEYKTINEILYNYYYVKDTNTLLDILRFRGYYVNPFSFLGSIFYMSELKNISFHFNLYPSNHFNTMHNIWGIERTSDLTTLARLEQKFKKNEKKRTVRSGQTFDENTNSLSTKKKSKNSDNINESNLKKHNFDEIIKGPYKKITKIKKNINKLNNNRTNYYNKIINKGLKTKQIWKNNIKQNKTNLNELFYIKFEDDLENNIKDEEIDNFFKTQNYVNSDIDIDEKNNTSNLVGHSKGLKRRLAEEIRMVNCEGWSNRTIYNIATMLKPKNAKKKNSHYNEQAEKEIIEIPNFEMCENFNGTEKINKRKEPSGKHKKKDFKHLLNKYLEKNMHKKYFNNYSNESETINLYNLIIKFINNKALLNNDSITYEKYIKKNSLEINHSIYKEFTIHTNYYMPEFNIHPLNKFINTFYNNNFKTLYLNTQKIKSKESINFDQQQKGEYGQNISSISKTSDNLSIIQSYENEKRAHDEVEEEESYEKNYDGKAKDEYLASDNAYDNILDPLHNSIENDIISQIDDLDQIESIKYSSGADPFDALNEIDKSSISKSDRETINFIENDKTQNTDESSEYADGSLFDEEEEQDDKDYISYSFYLHKPVYIYDEEKEMEKALSDIETAESETDDRKMKAKDEIEKTNWDTNKWNSNILLQKSKQFKKVYKKLIKKIEYDRNVKKECYTLYDKNNKFLMRDYKCIRQENVWGKFTKNHVIRIGKRKQIYDLLKGRHILINCISNHFYTYDQDVRTIVRMYKRHKFLLKNQKQKYFLKKYKNSYPWTGENMFICENDINKYIAAAYTTILLHKNTTYLKNFNYHHAREYIPLHRGRTEKALNNIPAMLCLLIKAFSTYLNCPFRELIIVLKRIERTFLFY
ncbi:conserved Plasmodium protein, unknown function [Plasmodium chabaudi chabaudi]|uniref:Uncharacterized protein n=1 Tax=Plasmodium chabaudi chabaudi TaxID=31271 RepID=A0A4V0KDW2_PLACU|nr:conserved Plasmodium protein, unknown function [Plasmodium chabaudi chabaudi]VTZ71081.1 conserved Plasmodium protein, unknown function [Plasmodium chabaudi chabaudi]|eukprot:XP_016654974.1 conserved Plasmodium protein, unknown function [Plasmodium chabaudi chabaudi]